MFPINWPSTCSIGISWFSSFSPNVSNSFSLECVLRSFGWTSSTSYFRVMIAYIYPITIFLFVLGLKFLLKKIK